jgi:hypothetical protein
LPLLALSVAGLAIRSRVGKGEGISQWRLTEGTIQSVDERSADNPAVADIADFSYTVNDDYFSGKVRVSRSFSTQGASPTELVNQKIQMRYNPRKPQKYSVPQAEVGGFLVDPYDDSFEWSSATPSITPIHGHFSGCRADRAVEHKVSSPLHHPLLPAGQCIH